MNEEKTSMLRHAGLLKEEKVTKDMMVKQANKVFDLYEEMADEINVLDEMLYEWRGGYEPDSRQRVGLLPTTKAIKIADKLKNELSNIAKGIRK